MGDGKSKEARLTPSGIVWDELFCIFQRKTTELEGVRCLRFTVDGIGGIGQGGEGGKSPDTSVAEIDDDLGIDLTAVVGGADEEGAGLEEVIGIRGLREDGVGRTQRTEGQGKKEKRDNSEKEVGGLEGVHECSRNVCTPSGNKEKLAGGLTAFEILMSVYGVDKRVDVLDTELEGSVGDGIEDIGGAMDELVATGDVVLQRGAGDIE
jgi:hypothetical protein